MISKILCQPTSNSHMLFWLQLSQDRLFFMPTAVRGNKGVFLSLKHLSCILWKNLSLSLSSMKSKNLAFFGLFGEGFFSLTASCNASFISPSLDRSVSGFICSTGLNIWTGSPALEMVSLLTGVRFVSKTVEIIGLLNHTLFLHRMDLLVVSWEIKNNNNNNTWSYPLLLSI